MAKKSLLLRQWRIKKTRGREKKDREKSMEILWVMETSLWVMRWSYRLQRIFNKVFCPPNVFLVLLPLPCLTNKLLCFWRLDISLSVSNCLLQTVTTLPTILTNLHPHKANTWITKTKTTTTSRVWYQNNEEYLKWINCCDIFSELSLWSRSLKSILFSIFNVLFTFIIIFYV